MPLRLASRFKFLFGSSPPARESDQRPEVFLQSLKQLEEPCRRLILLRYFEILTDEEVIQLKLTEYANAQSLKVQRCKCLKKLAVLLHGHKRFFIER